MYANVEEKSQINFVDFFVLFKALIIGLALGESWYLGYEVGKSIFEKIDPDFEPIKFVLFSIASLLCVANFCCYAWQRKFASNLSRVICSKRLDLLVILLFGILISIFFDGVSVTLYLDVLKRFSVGQLIVFTLLPIIFSFVLSAKAFYQSRQKKKTNPSFFLNDNEIKSLEGDLLGITKQAEKFAEYIWNNGSNDSLVFGIDAPWGIGKSSFVNICLKNLEKKGDARCVIHHFNVLHYQDRTNLLEKLIDGLVSDIQCKFFIPELDSIFKNYNKSVQGKVSLSLPGLRFDPNRNLDHAFEQLETAIKNLDAKIIIVIDDLDRLSISEIKEILFSIKKSFMLENVSYLLSYDTQNIVKQEGRSDNAESLREFLEKFINIKFCLFLESDNLSKYVNEHFEKAVSKSLFTDQVVVLQVKSFLSVVNEIYKANEYPLYQRYLGDIRKVKRLINLVLILEIEKTDFENSDIDRKDLLHLLLIYLNYPHIFRKIFDSESNGRSGLFSIKRFKEANQAERWENSDDFKEYISELPSDQKFLLNKLFSVDSLSSGKTRNMEDELFENHKSACFNRYSKNLERYLKLLVSLSKPVLEDQVQFYLNLKDKFMSGLNLNDLFEDNAIKAVSSEKTRKNLLNTIFNNAREMSETKATEVIEYICTHSSQYCLLSLPELDLGYRENLMIGLARVLDNAGWCDKFGGHVDNDDENVAEIACRVFGEGKYLRRGVLQLLSNSGRFELSMNEILKFRLYLCSNRHNGFYNLQRAIYLHSLPGRKFAGNTDDLTKEGMRFLSQKVFEIFKSTYITKKVNFFSVVNELQPDSLVGNYFEYLQSCMKNGLYQQTELDKQITIKKNEIKIFVSYQLTNTYESNGIGCGYYDEVGSADNKGIFMAMNDYFFDVCFAENSPNEGYKCFVDFLMLSWPRASNENDYDSLAPKLSDFTVILDQSKLINYWNNNRDSIKERGFENMDREVVTWNHTVNYKDKLKIIFGLLG